MSFLHLPRVWPLVAPSLPVAMCTSTVAPEYAESQRPCSLDSLASNNLAALAERLEI